MPLPTTKTQLPPNETETRRYSDSLSSWEEEYYSEYYSEIFLPNETENREEEDCEEDEEEDCEEDEEEDCGEDEEEEEDDDRSKARKAAVLDFCMIVIFFGAAVIFHIGIYATLDYILHSVAVMLILLQLVTGARLIKATRTDGDNWNKMWTIPIRQIWPCCHISLFLFLVFGTFATVHKTQWVLHSLICIVCRICGIVYVDSYLKGKEVAAESNV